MTTTAATSRVRREIYISSGLKNGFYTLRSHTASAQYSTDQYLRNLSTDPDKAEEKARAYFDRVYGTGCMDVVFLGFADFDLTPWGQCLAPWERAQLAEVDAGFWPFGKYKGFPIDNAPDGYLLFWSEQKPEAGKAAGNALIERCRSIADERGLKQKFEERRREIATKRAASSHVGTVGKREVFAVQLVATFGYDTQFGHVFGHIMEDAAGNTLIYKGSKSIGEKGTAFSLKATVKEHGEREGCKQTLLSRPVIV